MASTELTRTFSSGNRRTFTFSAWIKASQISSDGAFFQSGTNGSGEFWTFNLQANGGMYVQGRTDATDNTWLYTSPTLNFFVTRQLGNIGWLLLIQHNQQNQIV